jgi:uncharacterized membrane protein
VTSLLKRGAAYGFAGWTLENSVWGPRYSSLFGGVAVPFLPVYAVGGLAVHQVAPALKNWNLAWWQRGLAYALGLSAIEYAGCRIDREVFEGCAWDYTHNRCLAPARGCVDLKHAFLWGVLGLVAEKV